MTFRTRLLLLFGVAIGATAIAVSYAISLTVTRAFERLDDQRARSLIAQFQREFDWRSREVVRRIDAIAASDSVLRLAAEFGRSAPDPAPYHDLAAQLAREHGLDFLELVDGAGSIVSSAHYPARFGYRKEWITQPLDWRSLGAFVEIEELPEESAVALLAVRPVSGSTGVIFVAGGQRIDKGFLDSLATPRGISAALYRDLPAASGRLPYAAPEVSSLVAQVRGLGRESSTTVAPWFEAPRTTHGIPLNGRSKDLLGVLLVTSSRHELYQISWFIRWVALLGALAAIVLGGAIGWWATARLSRPLRELALGARNVAAGEWNTRVPVQSTGEIGELAHAFNQMTRDLAEQRDRLVQIERVAAWRELARRLAHELKNPLFPLQITVENLQRARLEHPAQFDEVFRESTTTLLAELGQLKTIVARFSDFARMPAPRFEQVRLADVISPLFTLFEPQWNAPGHPPVRAELKLADPALAVEADPEQLSRALRNLILNAMDAMPSGGTISVSAARANSHVVIEVADTGAGLTSEECQRLFTPYYTTRQHGTGLGLAIVQSVVSDHGGRISVESAPGRGSVFRLEFPLRLPHGPASDH